MGRQGKNVLRYGDKEMAYVNRAALQDHGRNACPRLCDDGQNRSACGFRGIFGGVNV